MKYFFPVHLDGDNRGCEGIAKGTAILLGEPKDNLIGLCRNVELDKKLGIDDYITLVPYHRLSFIKSCFNKLLHLCKLFHLFKNKKYIEVDQMNLFVQRFQEGDVMLSTGGDMFCYGDNLPSVISAQYAQEKGIMTVLWGCSMGPENLSPAKERILRNFTLIYARESLSYDFFKSLGLKKIVCLPDPAFALDPEQIPLPDFWGDSDVIGINLSNYTVGDFNINTPFGNQIRELITYILNNTNKNILLIPHVMWEHKGDFLISKSVLNAFPYSKDRINILNSDNYNYLQIRYVISKCWCFIGGRTHAVISAYSTCIPTIALGYSIKAKGIAKDLQLPEELVVDCSANAKKGSLLDSYIFLEEHYDDIKKHMDSYVPLYKKNVYKIKEIMKEYIY